MLHFQFHLLVLIVCVSQAPTETKFFFLLLMQHRIWLPPREHWMCCTQKWYILLVPRTDFIVLQIWWRISSMMWTHLFRTWRKYSQKYENIFLWICFVKSKLIFYDSILLLLSFSAHVANCFSTRCIPLLHCRHNQLSHAGAHGSKRRCITPKIFMKYIFSWMNWTAMNQMPSGKQRKWSKSKLCETIWLSSNATLVVFQSPSQSWKRKVFYSLMQFTRSIQFVHVSLRFLVEMSSWWNSNSCEIRTWLENVGINWWNNGRR